LSYLAAMMDIQTYVVSYQNSFSASLNDLNAWMVSLMKLQ